VSIRRLAIISDALTAERRPRVLVLATEFRAGPWACRSLRRAGFEVIGAHHEGGGGRSLQCPRPLRYPSPSNDADGFRDAVAEICRSRRVSAVLPVSEDATRALADAPPDLAGAVLVGPTPEQYAAACDKAALAGAAAASRVAHPPTVLVTRAGPSGPWPRLPAIIKPRVLGEDGGDVPPVIVAETAEQREAAVRRYIDAGPEPIVQELVGGQPWSVHAVSRRSGVLATAIRVAATYPRRVGTTSHARTSAPPPGLLEGAARLLAHLAYRGPCSFNYMERDGVFHVHDVNLRLSSSVGLSISSGLDVPALAVADALGLPDPGVPPRGRAMTYVRWDGEARALRDALRSDSGESPGTLARRLARGVLARGHIVDPPPLEPFLLLRRTQTTARAAARRARRRAR
jgi:carbamoyl-phosphate synthase large subunit